MLFSLYFDQTAIRYSMYGININIRQNIDGIVFDCRHSGIHIYTALGGRIFPGRAWSTQFGS